MSGTSRTLRVYLCFPRAVGAGVALGEEGEEGAERYDPRLGGVGV